MKKIIFHVGPHKTGSTSLQFRLLKSREWLREHSFEYPAFGIPTSAHVFAHHQICSFLAGGAAGAGDVTASSLRSCVNDHPQIILSSEDFIYLARDKLKAFRDSFYDYDIEVVIFVRSPVDLWPSHWQELVKHGRHETFIEYLGAFCGWNTTIQAQIMNPYVQASKFSDVFGRDHLRIFCYDNIVDSGVDIFEFFCKRVLKLGAPLPPGEPRTLNPSLPPDRIELLRCLNERFLEVTGNSPDATILERYQHLKGNVEASQDYADFREAFKARASEIHLESTQELFRNRERMLLNNFWQQIENRVEDNRIYAREVFKRKVRYGERYWIDRFGFRGFVDEVLSSLDVGGMAEATSRSVRAAAA